ncbi:MAG: zinc D-Ala-D-Ala carboxypeptidase, partial [Blastocatellia bacterium]|nr:zinc D-Ala-D-Ala carboxypeptidase [Blastocatellia bacterium]
DANFNDVVKVRVPSIYGTKGDPLPERMAKLVRPAALALQKVYQAVAAEGGHLFISDMFRTFAEQQKAHSDFITGRKKAFSPPACNSVHESARAIDIDAFDTEIGHRRVRQILNAHGWVNIVVTLTGSECWHYEFREQKFEDIKKARGYTAMARSMKEEIGNVGDVGNAEKEKEKVKFIQDSLNKIMGLNLGVDGIYGERTKQAIRDFQARFDLQVDGVVGPITLKKIRAILEQG